jgi:hypothetical protein
MKTFISGIIDCVARPSTSDTPVRVLRKCDPCNTPSTEASEPNSPSLLDASGHSTHSSVSSVFPNALESDVGPLPSINILTAEGIIDDDGGPAHDVDNDDCADDFLSFSIGSCRSYRSIDDATAKIFEEAFAEFLWKNPAFSSMSYITLKRLREKLRRQSAKNVEVEAELRMRLEQLKESNRRTELMLQKELLGASNSKSMREAELLKHIQESRDDRASVGTYPSSLLTYPTGRRVPPSHVGYPPPLEFRCPPSLWEVPYEVPYEEVNYQEGIRRSKMEQAHMIAEMEKIKQEKMKREIPGLLLAIAKL